MLVGAEVYPGNDPFTWNQISVLLTIIGAVIGGVVYLSKAIDKKVPYTIYETKHQALRDEVGKIDLRLTRLEERHRRMVDVLHKNGIKE